MEWSLDQLRQFVTAANGSTPLCSVDCPSLALPPLSVRMLWRQGRQLRPPEKWVETRFSELLCENAERWADPDGAS